MSIVLGGPGLRPRVVVVMLAFFVAVLGATVVGYLYINHVAAGIARVPVMFAPSETSTAPR